MSSNAAAAILFFVGLALCFWRWAYADRWHSASVALAAIVWSSLPLFEASMRRWYYAAMVSWMLFCALRARRRPERIA